MFSFLRRHRRRFARRHPVPPAPWREALERFSFLAALAPREQVRLRRLVRQFLDDKTFEAAAGLEIDDSLRIAIASQACLLILNLGMEYYAGWSSIVVYPGAFRVHRQYLDYAGVVHEASEILSGESWQRGPVVLSWQTAVSPPHPDQNVVIHEFAHKIDMLNGQANGFPPLHRDMDARQWAIDFGTAYAALRHSLDAGETVRIDPYAAIKPGEFFAVLTETFFMNPRIVFEDYPVIYAQLARFYRQDPGQRAGMPTSPDAVGASA
ncbi:MAG: M90 family metallopeptidase [Acidiferrobacterales bacterium]